MRAFYSAPAISKCGERPGTLGVAGPAIPADRGYRRRAGEEADGLLRRSPSRSATTTPASSSARRTPLGLGRDARGRSELGDRRRRVLREPRRRLTSLSALGVRAQLLSLAAPQRPASAARPDAFALDGTTGWSVLVDSEDQWTLSGPFAVTYGLAARQTSTAPARSTLTAARRRVVTGGRMDGARRRPISPGDPPIAALAGLRRRGKRRRPDGSVNLGHAGLRAVACAFVGAVETASRAWSASTSTTGSPPTAKPSPSISSAMGPSAHRVVPTGARAAAPKGRLCAALGRRPRVVLSGRPRARSDDAARPGVAGAARPAPASRSSTGRSARVRAPRRIPQ